MCCLLVLALRWAGGPLLLLTWVLLLLTRGGGEGLGGSVVVRHLIPWRSNVVRSCHNLPLLCFLVSVDCIIHDDDIADKF
jgi:hypothetical protein